MIKTNELRVGNFYIDRSGNYFAFTFEDFIFYRDTWFNMLEPIAITSQILEKCGCIKWTDTKDVNEVDKWSTASGLDFHFYKFGDETATYFNLNNKIFSAKYLHEFQNVLALTGEEINYGA